MNETTKTTAVVNYRGVVIDRLEKEVAATTKPYPTWEAAQQAAEKLAKRKGLTGDRYCINVS